MSMANKMKEKAVPATSAKRSSKLIKTVNRADVVELNRTMQPIIEQNKKEREDSWKLVHNQYVGTKYMACNS